MRLKGWLLPIMLVVSLAGQQNHAPVVLSSIEVQGTHLPQDSMIKLLGIKIGDTADDAKLKAACQRVLSTGLIADINYSLTADGAGTKGAIIFTVADEKNLLPATVVPEQNEAPMWSCLQDASSIFEKSLPNTKDAMLFYVANMNRCLTTTSDQPLHAVAQVLCDMDQKPSKIEFRIERGPVEPTRISVVIVKP